MNLDMWLKDDLRNVLLGIDLASAQMAAGRDDRDGEVFRAGFRSALTTVAVSLGICLPELLPAERAGLGLPSIEPRRLLSARRNL